jgi:hypothetical protein
MNTAIQTLFMIGSLGAMMFTMLKFMLRDIHKDLDNINKRFDKSETRIDHLYQICIDLLQTRR